MDTATHPALDDAWSLVRHDPTLATALGAGALALWDAQAGRAAKADAALTALTREGIVPQATRARLGQLAGGLASLAAPRLERLRLTQGFNAALATCVVKRIAVPDGPDLLALIVPQGELRRLALPAGAPTATESPVSTALAATEPTPPESPPARPLRAVERFLWESDNEGRLSAFSGALAEIAGAGRIDAWTGRLWNDLIGRDVIDRDGGLAERLARSVTFSGHTVLWRTGPREGMRADLSGMPTRDAAGATSGLRGFGVVRTGEREEMPDESATATPVAAPVSPDVPDDTTAQALTVSDTEASQQMPSTDVADAGTAEADLDTDAMGSPDELAPTQTVAAAEPDDGPEQPAAEADIQASTASGEVETTEQDNAPELQETMAEPDTAEADPVTAEPVRPGDDAFVAEDDGDEVSIDEETAQAAGNDASEEAPAAEEPETSPEPPANVYPLRNPQVGAVRPVLEPSKTNLSSAERNAFREIAKALGARIAGEEDASPDQAGGRRASDRLAAAATAKANVEPTAERSDTDGGETVSPAPQRQVNAHAEILDRLPLAVLVNRDDEALYANRTLLDLLDYADLDDIAASGGVSRLIRGAARADGGAMTLIDRVGRFLAVDAVLASIAWSGEPATLMAFRHRNGGGEVAELSEEEAEEAEMAAEFAAEEAESAARVEALRLDAAVRDARIAELSAMLDTATDGVVSLDGGGRILALNKTAEALFGYDQREVTGELFTLLFASESHAPALDYLEGLKGGGVASILNDGREVLGRVRQGGSIPLFMTMGRIVEGAEPRFCAVLRDITAWKKTEGELVEARKAAEKASAQKSDVLAKISHEIRTPLNAIIGFAEVMADERFGPIANERYKEYLRDIHQSGGYVISLVNDLLDLAKIEAGKLDLDFESVNLNEIAVSAVGLMQQQAQRGRVVLRTGLSPKLPPVVADQRSIRQIVLNLLSNAVKFTDAGGQVIISTALGDRGEAILRVRDTGIGMDDNELKLALEPFRQVPTTRRSNGTGLGLPLTRALVDANRAAMSITSVKKEGTLVEITFPPQRVLAG